MSTTINITEDETFKALKGLTSDEMLAVLRNHYHEYNRVMNFYVYILNEDTNTLVTRERNALLRKHGWTHRSFVLAYFNPVPQ